MRSDNTLGMKFEGVTTNLFHDIVDEKVTVELLLQNQNFMLDQDTIIVIEGYDFIVISKDN